MNSEEMKILAEAHGWHKYTGSYGIEFYAGRNEDDMAVYLREEWRLTDAGAARVIDEARLTVVPYPHDNKWHVLGERPKATLHIAVAEARLAQLRT